ncbi:MAG: AAA domain-containing protein [Sporomusaceae bacterium]|nr:AAA domain-containing protein [Sporomusaceae bacterium]
MDPSNNLVLVRNSNSGKYEDKTIQVQRITREHGRTRVEFAGGKSYTYLSENVKVYGPPKTMSQATHILYVDDYPLNDCDILDFGPYVKEVRRNGSSNIYARERVTVKKSCLENHKEKSVFDYLKALAPYVSPENDEEYAGRNFLLDQYKNITKVDPDSVLAAYLSGDPISETRDDSRISFPFGLNLSQMDAAKQAFAHSMSIIEGPPGTGKTQTILNVIANAVFRGKSVAVVSANNSAISNVQEKLQAAGYGFLTALLGNSENQKSFFERQITEGDYQKLKQDPTVVNNAYKSLDRISRQLEGLLATKNEVAKLRDEIARLQAEQAHFNAAFQSADIPLSRFSYHSRWSSSKMLEFIHYLERVGTEDRQESIATKAWLFLRYGIYRFRFLFANVSDVVTSIYRLYYKNGIGARQVTIAAKEKELMAMNYDALTAEHKEHSNVVFQASLHRRYGSGARKIYSKGSFKQQFKDFISDYPVILSTTYSIRKSIPPNFLFDYLVIDESSQTDIVTGALAMSCCRNIVIVGDGEQLGQIVSSSQKTANETLFSQHDIHASYNYERESILSSVARLYGNGIKRTLLREHYRCHPRIIRFCNEKFYDNQLVVLTDDSEDSPLYLFRTAPGNHAREVNTSREKGHYNLRQIEIIRDEILGGGRYGDGSEVGIISPYRLHANETQRIISKIYPGIEADTVHKFQGREKQTIIYSTVLDKCTPHNDKRNLINVAVSRAVRELIVVTGNNLIRTHGTNLGDLIRYIQYNSPEQNVIESQKLSVFDLLYTEHSDRLRKIWKIGTVVSEFPSENIMYAVINELLDKAEFASFKCVIHIPLSRIVKDFSTLSPEEAAFAQNPWSHVDFLLFNKLDKEPVLAVEVDGFSCHRNKEDQQRRDRLKNSILEKINLPLLRFPTEGSGEIEKLTQSLTALKKEKIKNTLQGIIAES